MDYQYTGGPGGDVTDANNYSPTTLFDVDFFASSVPGGLRVYGLDIANDMDNDGVPEVVFTRGSTRGGHDAPAIFILELDEIFSPPTSVEDLFASQPDKFALAQNYPNPFNPETLIAYNLPKTGNVVINIYNLVGQKVRTLVHTFQTVGVHTVKWDAKNDQGIEVPTGMYIYRIVSGEFTGTKRMLLLR